MLSVARPLQCSGYREAWREGGKLGLGEALRGKGAGLGYVFVSYYENGFELAVNGTDFPQGEFDLPATATGKQSPCLYLDPQAFSSCFSPVLLKSDWRGWMGVWPFTKVNPPQS